MSVLVPLATGAVSALAGHLLNRNKPEVPDVSVPVLAEYARKRALLEQMQGRTLERVEDLSQRQGGSARGLVEDVIGQNQSALANLSAAEADSVARATMQNRLNKYQQQLATFQNRAQGIGDLIGGIGAGVQSHFDEKAFRDRLAMVQAMRGGDILTPGVGTLS